MAGRKFGDDWCLNKIIWDNLMALCIVRINCIVLIHLFSKSYKQFFEKGMKVGVS